VTTRELSIAVQQGGAVSARLDEGAPPGEWLLVYAPGAGSNIDDPFGAFAAARLSGEGVDVLRFQFPYQEAGKRRPDANAVLEGAWRAALETAAALAGRRRIVAGGRSMGGRIASQVVAAGAAADALALFAYPLHQPGRPERPRDAHLGAVHVPTLFCSGTRDAFASPDELRAAAAKAQRSAVHLLAGADHGFAVPRSSGRTRADVWSEACDALVQFLRTLA
jgi:predicted alpha/beta-hydrolase family hydrolase